MGFKEGTSRTSLAFSACAAIAATGCHRFETHRDNLARLHENGQYERAKAVLESPETIRQYGSKNSLLRQLDLGAVSLAVNDDDGCIRVLEEAERRLQLYRQSSVADIAARWTINDAAAAYIAEPYEDIYVNVLKLLAQFEAGRISGGASVEARRLIAKSNLLRDRYLTYREALEKKAESLPESARSGALVPANEEGEFLESTLGTYLTAVAFMEDGEPSMQEVAGRRLASSITLQRGLIGDIQPDAFEGLGEVAPDDADVLIVAFSGRGPTKYAERIGPIALGTVPIYFELPKLRTNPSEVASVEVEVDGYEPSPLALVEDLSAVATENHRRMLPLIYTRTLIRAIAKTTASVILTEAARKEAHDDDQLLVQVAGVLAGLAVIAATEKADTRTWIFLPGQAHVALLDLPPGDRNIRVIYRDSSGGEVFATEWQPVPVRERGLSTIVTHYWR